jgi:hypothetical protein
MAKVLLNIDPNALEIETFEEDGKTKHRLNVKISTDEHNTITVEEDGLYSEGDPASVGKQLDTPQIHGGVRVGYRSQWDLNQEGKNRTRVSCNGITHRTWTADDMNGTHLRGKNPADTFRGQGDAPADEQNLDMILPGDFLRVPVADNKFNYYIITKVNERDRIEEVALLLGGGDDF